MHHNLYTIINSAAMNGVGENTVVRQTTPKLLELVEDVTMGLGIAAILSFIGRKEFARRMTAVAERLGRL